MCKKVRSEATVIEERIKEICTSHLSCEGCPFYARDLNNDYDAWACVFSKGDPEEWNIQAYADSKENPEDSEELEDYRRAKILDIIEANTFVSESYLYTQFKPEEREKVEEELQIMLEVDESIYYQLVVVPDNDGEKTERVFGLTD